MSLAIDGTANGQALANTTLTANLTTTQINDYIIVCIDADTAIISVSSPILGTFTQLCTTGSAPYTAMYAVFSTGILSSETITVTQTQAGNIRADFFGVSSSNQTSLVFDAGGPVTGSSAPLSITTVNSNTMVIGTFSTFFISGIGPGAGFTLIPGSDVNFITTEYAVLSSTATTSVGTGNDGVVFGAAVIAIVENTGPPAPPKIAQYSENPVLAKIPVNYGTWTEVNTYLIGFDKLPKNRYDWPNPEYQRPTYREYTWKDRRVHIIGKDILPKNRYDWPDPILTPYREDAYNWWDSFPLSLIGKDKLPKNRYDWPNPTLAPYRDCYSWDDYFSLSLIGKDKLPKNKYDWPNTWYFPGLNTGFVESNALRAVVQPPLNLNAVFINPVIYLLPARDWQYFLNPPAFPSVSARNELPPKGAPYPKDWQSFIVPVGQDLLPNRQQDWPIPKGYIPNQGWLLQYNNSLYFVPGLPNNQYSWPNPLILLRNPQDWINFLTNISTTPIPPPIIQIFGGRTDGQEIDGKRWREGIKQLDITRAAQALGRKGGIASGKTRR